MYISPDQKLFRSQLDKGPILRVIKVDKVLFNNKTDKNIKKETH